MLRQQSDGGRPVAASFDFPAGYATTPGSPLEADRAFYTAIAQRPEDVPVQTLEVPVRAGVAWRVSAGKIFRISIVDGPQVGDLNLWSASNPRERFWAARTRQLQRTSVTTFDRLWSTLPFLRPMATMVADSLADHPDAIAIHDLLGTRCDPYVNRLLTGEDFDYHCHSNLVRAVRPYGLTEYDVHDVLNLFQFAGSNTSSEYFFAECPAKTGDYVEFFAEIDLICAISTCPGGDLSVPMWGPGASPPEVQLQHCHPLRVDIFDVPSELLHGWRPPSTNPYDGAIARHALRDVPFEQPSQGGLAR